ncbi:undecaprenyl-phosphate glucose phosphotransferase [Duganella sp. FT50W]|uniref:Undecaprenyl-phosphate glucose phosphotransferase n=1 Tax=Duganella lactea TaxID=2692173 RepID=A0A6L8MQH5_9BURK|nr:undecaprenyl-phosphate glucose phosphotransferase [Duganella lactea]MYM36481.1 undecaprenyl-phosphate glucose phosphotransferase [Duganella lactea]MYM83995.1 undecaprenyl-phosphate glucose phosphotransferase [Duganella lactea]
MNISDLPVVTFFQRVLDPLIIMGNLYVCAAITGAPFDGYMLILMVLAFYVSSSVYAHIDPYRNWRRGRWLAYLRDVLGGWALAAGVLWLLAVCCGLETMYDTQALLLWALSTPLLLVLLNYSATWGRGDGASAVVERSSVVIIGANDLSLKFVDRIESQTGHPLQIQGFFDDRTPDRYPLNMRHPILGTMADVASYVRAHHVKLIYISQPISAQPRIRKLIDELQDTTASVYFLPDIYVFDLMQARFDSVAGIPVIAICETPFIGVNSLVKRISDIVLALLIQILLLPLMLVIAALVKFTSPGPVIFRQRRYGLYGEEIIVYKFRSMTVTEDGDKVVQARKGDQRVTPIGAFLRKTSLDELPQFFNVLQGRMSIVGPRPHAVAHNEQYRKLIKGYMLRHKVKPGITGWAQVNGLRGETETLDKMEARIQYDLDYLRSWSLWLDLWIILRTVKVVLKRDNAF